MTKREEATTSKVLSFMWPSIKIGITERVGVLQAGEWGISWVGWNRFPRASSVEIRSLLTNKGVEDSVPEPKWHFYCNASLTHTPSSSSLVWRVWRVISNSNGGISEIHKTYLSVPRNMSPSCLTIQKAKWYPFLNFSKTSVSFLLRVVSTSIVYQHLSFRA